MKIAIIGAGIAGISASLELQKIADITLFEKSRGVGRLATRYNQAYQFDFGAPFFRIKHNKFNDFLKYHLAESYSNVLQTWFPKIAQLNDGDVTLQQSEYPHYIALPKMTSLGRQLAANLNNSIHFKTRIVSIEKKQQKWLLKTDDSDINTEFDWVVFATPLEQTQVLLPNEFNQKDILQTCKTDACFTLMLGLRNNEALCKFTQKFDIIDCSKESSMIDKIVIENKKTQQTIQHGSPLSLTVFSDNKWAEANVDKELDVVEQLMTKEVFRLLSLTTADIKHTDLHRWRYANVSQSVNSVDGSKKHLIDKEQHIACIGDWCHYGSVEGAWESAMSATTDIKAFIK